LFQQELKNCKDAKRRRIKAGQEVSTALAGRLTAAEAELERLNGVFEVWINGGGYEEEEEEEEEEPAMPRGDGDEDDDDDDDDNGAAEYERVVADILAASIWVFIRL